MSAHFVAAAGLLAVGALLVLGGSAQHLAIATEALAVRVLARRAGLHVANVASHGLFIIVGLLLMRDFIDVPNPTVPVFNSGGITMLWSIVSIAGAAFVMPHTSVRRFYLYSAHTLILFWILHQFSHISSGQAAVSVIWGLYGASVLIVGLRRGIRQVRTTGLVTLLAVVAKLFLVDLESVRAIWRVLLFIGFGGVFLALSYWFLSLDRSRKHEESDVSKT
jgi:hypothetical protein